MKRGPKEDSSAEKNIAFTQDAQRKALQQALQNELQRAPGTGRTSTASPKSSGASPIFTEVTRRSSGACRSSSRSARKRPAHDLQPGDSGIVVAAPGPRPLPEVIKRFERRRARPPKSRAYGAPFAAAQAPAGARRRGSPASGAASRRVTRVPVPIDIPAPRPAALSLPVPLVDAVVQHEPGRRVVAVKNVTVSEEFFQGHFPGPPLMPGVLMIESLAQVATILLLDREDAGGGAFCAASTTRSSAARSCPATGCGSR